MEGLLGSLKQQWKKGEPYRVAVGGLLSGDTQPLMGLLNAPVKADPMSVDQAMQLALDWSNPISGVLGHTVYHGSPHKFTKFDMSKIGTGEGAQAYGHGLYFAESPAVAKDYATNLSSAGLARHKLTQSGGDMDKAISDAQQSINNYKNIIANGGGGDPRRAQGMLNLAEKNLNDLLAMKSGTLDEAGHIYKVDIPDEVIPKMLDWDKPLSQQAPDVQSVLGPMFGPNAAGMTGQEIYKKAAGFDSMVNVASKTDGNVARMKSIFPQATDAQIQQAIAAAKNAGGNDRIASDMLRQAGIPGIRYLDGGSRGTGQGTYNYVVFDDGIPKILEINGQPLK